ncbi:MAG TPA: hypothetical protein VK628_08630 [Flavitalea sp.]|nr:hypothetical protein [Flavitalea sp.]
MKNIFFVACVFLLGSATLPAQQPHVVLISVDGFRPEFYKEAAWSMVNLTTGGEVAADRITVFGRRPLSRHPGEITLILI